MNAALAWCVHGSALRPNINFFLRDWRIESIEQDEAGEKAAYVRLPGDLLPLFGNRHGAEAKERIQSEPYGDEGQEPRIAQCRDERGCRHAIGLSVALPPPH